jgi:phenylacetic acid degradation operon negative regulatory protein
VEAARIFGIDANRLRVALARLVAANLVASDGSGRYWLGRASASIVAHVTSWRTVEQRVRPWTGEWVAVHTGALLRSDRRQVRGCERALRLLGFRPLAWGLELRPDNLAGGVDAVRNRLHALGLPEPLPVFIARDLSVATDAEARRLWNANEIHRRYRKTITQLETSSRRIPDLTEERAMVESFLIGGQAIREVVHDPLLPDEICSGVERRRLVSILREYDRLGRDCWVPFLKRHGMPHRNGPKDLRVSETAARSILQMAEVSP